MMKISALLGFIIAFQVINAQSYQFTPNYDESKVPHFEVPDPLRSFDGKKIKNTRQWERKRKPELLEFFTSNVYGRIPGDLEITSWEIVEESREALHGKANRKQVDLHFTNNGKHLTFNVLIYTPANIKKAPLFLGYNFYGNHTVTNDEHILISKAWARENESMGVINNRMSEKGRGVSANSWQLDQIIDAGYGLATVYYGEVDPDKDDFSDGVHALLYEPGQSRPCVDEWGSLGAWAW